MLLKDKLKIRAVEQGLKVSDIPAAAGMCDASYYMKLNGTQALKFDEAIAICDLLDYSLDEFRLLYEGRADAARDKAEVS